MTEKHKTHPTAIRMRRKAAALGCRAETLRGIIKFLTQQRDNYRNNTSRFGEACTPYEKFYWSKESCVEHGARRRQARREAYKAAEAERTADAEIKRARNDKTFRAKFLRTLTRRERIARTCNVHSMADAIAYFDSTQSRHAELLGIRDIRRKIDVKLGNYTVVSSPIPGMAQLIQTTPEACRKVGAPVNMRGKDSTLKAIFGPSEFDHASGVTHWKNGRPQRYERATCINHVRSFAYIESDREISYVLHERRFSITLPEGYGWQRDANGLRAVLLATGDDYHVDADDLVRRGAAKHIVEKIEANATKRRAAEASVADIPDDVFVCLKDSLTAGNCRAGTLAFAARFGLQVGRHYAASLLKKLAPKEPRLRIALVAAAKRNTAEVSRGYCNLSDHSC